MPPILPADPNAPSLPILPDRRVRRARPRVTGASFPYGLFVSSGASFFLTDSPRSQRASNLLAKHRLANVARAVAGRACSGLTSEPWASSPTISGLAGDVGRALWLFTQNASFTTQ